MTDKSEVDELLEQLEDAREAGRSLSVEEVCGNRPELIDAVRSQWDRLCQFDENFGTRLESTEDVEEKLAGMPENLVGSRLVAQSELHLEAFHDHGGLGDVYRAHDGEISREIAVKMLRFDRQSARNAEDFKRESQIIGRMNHPGIVSIHGAGETIDGRPFYTMPFLEGGNLRSRIAHFHQSGRARLSENDKEFRDLIYRLATVCKTIAYAHARGIVHRDIKSENILLGRYGETLVIDWGCAAQVQREARFKVSGEQTMNLAGVSETTSSRGLTLRYASPEQLHGSRSVGPESDIYSLGSVLYLIITGQSPLESEPDESVRQSVLQGRVPSAETIRPGVPRALAAICQKAMSLDPAARYETALMMADDLERYLADEAVSVCRTSLGMKLARGVRQNRTASLLLACTLVCASILLMVAFAGQSFFARRARDSATERLRMAATLASNVGGYEISRRFSLLENEAKSPDLIEAMLKIQSDPGNRELWMPAQILVYQFADELAASNVELESMFLTDAKGWQVARAPKTESVGRNYAYRHYFHGLDQDHDPTSAQYQQHPPAPSNRPIISNAYVSTNLDASTGEYPIKTAFTVPILHTDADGNQHVLGRLGMSLRVNHLSIFKRLQATSLDGILIETRNYDWGSESAQGLLLDRIRNKSDDFTVPAISLTKPDERSAAEVKDSMPRLSDATLETLQTLRGGKDQTLMLPSFFDPAISDARQDAAFSRLSIPDRPELSTGWTVIFLDRGPR